MAKVRLNVQYPDISKVRSVQAIISVALMLLSSLVVPCSHVIAAWAPSSEMPGNEAVDTGTWSRRQVDHDLLIIEGHLQVTDALRSLKGHKEALGIRTELVHIDDIVASTPGRDEAEKVKRYIYDAYVQDHIRYVLLIGSGKGAPPVFPVRYATAPWVTETDNPLPSDLYYGDVALDVGGFSSWDTDGDDLFGVFGMDDVDYVPEVAVGRLPVSSGHELEVAISHIINYTNMTARLGPGEEGDWFRRAVLVGTDSHPTWQIPSTHNPDIASGEFQIDNLAQERLIGNDVHLYKEWDGSISGEAIQADLDDGAGIFYISDHGYLQTKGDRKVNVAAWNVSWDEIRPAITEDLLRGLRNGDRLFFATTNICDGAKYDEDGRDGFITAYLFNPEGGAIGYYAASRVAWDGNGKYIPRTYSGRLLDNLFLSLQEGAPTYGDAVRTAQAKFARENLEIGGGQWLNLVEFNYFGDPTVPPGGGSLRVSAVTPQRPHTIDASGRVEFMVTNNGFVGIEVDLSLAGVPSEWDPVLSADHLVLGPGQRKTVTVDYTWPDGIELGHEVQVELVAKENDGQSILDMARVPIRVAGWERVLDFDIGTVEQDWKLIEQDTFWVVEDLGPPNGKVLRYQEVGTGDYYHMMDETIMTELGLEDAEGNVSLVLWADHFIEEGYDHAYVEGSRDNVTWEIMHDFTYRSNGWNQTSINLSWLAGSPGYLRFRFSTDEFTNEWGITIDNLTVSNGTTVFFTEDFEGGLDAWFSRGYYYETPMMNIRTADSAGLRLDTAFNRTWNGPGTHLRVWRMGNNSYWGLDSLIGEIASPETRYLDMDEYAGETIKLRIGPLNKPGLVDNGIFLFTGTLWTETRAVDISISDLQVPLVIGRNTTMTGKTKIVNKGTDNLADIDVNITLTSPATGLSFELVNTSISLMKDEEKELTFEWTSPSGPETSGWYNIEVVADATGDAYPSDNAFNDEVFIGDIRFNDDMEVVRNDYSAPKGEFDVSWNRLEGESHSGDFAWTAGDGSAYLADSELYLFLPLVNVSGLYKEYLCYWYRSELETAWDNITLQASTDGGPWVHIWNYTGIDFSWRRAVLDITDIVGNASDLELRFVLRSDATLSYKGWFLDDVIIFGSPEYLNLSFEADNTTFSAPPGATVDLMFSIANSGNVGTSIEVDLAGKDASWGTVNGTTVQLGPNGRVDVAVNVTIPYQTIAGYNGNLSVVALASGYDGPDMVIAVSVKVERVTGLALSYASDTKEEMVATIGLIRNMFIGMENLGNGKEVVTFARTIWTNGTPNEGWLVQCPDNITLDPYGKNEVRVSVQPPDNATYHDIGNVTLHAVPSSNISKAVNISVNFTVAWSRGIKLQVPDDISGKPGTTVKVEVNITNTGNGPDGYNTSVRSASGWVIGVAPTDLFNVTSGATLPIEVSITIPDTVIAGTKDIIEVRTSPHGTIGWVVYDTIDVSVERTRDMRFEFPLTDQANLSGKRGDEISISFLIDNIGNGDERVDIQGPEGWETSPLVPGPYTIKAFNNRTGLMRVQIHKNAPIGENVLRFTLVSKAEGEEGEILEEGQVTINVEKVTPPDTSGHISLSVLVAAVTSVILVAIIVISVLLGYRRRGEREGDEVTDEDDGEDGSSEE